MRGLLCVLLLAGPAVAQQLEHEGILVAQADTGATALDWYTRLAEAQPVPLGGSGRFRNIIATGTIAAGGTISAPRFQSNTGASRPGITFVPGLGEIDLDDGAGHTILSTNGSGQVATIYTMIAGGFNLSSASSRITFTSAGRYLDSDETTGTLRLNSWAALKVSGSANIASFPAASSAGAGALGYDQAALQLKLSNGVGWLLPSPWLLAGYYDGNQSATANNTVAETDTVQYTSGGNVRLWMTVTRAGTDGTHNVTVRARDITNSANFCTLTFACNAAAGPQFAVCTNVSAAGVGTKVALQIDTSACTTTTPLGNLSVLFQ